MIFRYFLAISAIFLLSFCSSAPKTYDSRNITQAIPQSEYSDQLERFTKSDENYRGFYNAYQVSVTMLNSLVESNVIQQKGYYFQWDKSKTRTEREKMFQEHSSKSKFLLVFFTPERKDNNLEKINTIWKVYLQVNGQRFLGSVKKMNVIYSQFVQLYPHFTRWNKAYEVTFDIPMNEVETQPSSIVVTSSLGSSKFNFESIGLK